MADVGLQLIATLEAAERRGRGFAGAGGLVDEKCGDDGDADHPPLESEGDSIWERLSHGLGVGLSGGREGGLLDSYFAMCATKR